MNEPADEPKDWPLSDLASHVYAIEWNEELDVHAINYLPIYDTEL